MDDPWLRLRQFTQARIGLDRHGHAIATTAWLELQLAQALARDAVWRPWDATGLAQRLKGLGETSIIVASQVADRALYLQRPDLGRTLSAASWKLLADRAAVEPAELAVIVTDGLSPAAIDAHFLEFWKLFAPQLQGTGIRRGPLVIAPFGRVALSDAVGEVLQARLAVIFVGERPGLSSSDSMGIYVTYDPRPGNHDAQRNCISNIRPPQGLGYELACMKLMYLIQESVRLKLSGVGLKEAASWQRGIRD